MNNLREKMAEIAHGVWAGWMTHMFKCAHITSKVLPPLGQEDCVERWRRQLATPYDRLTPKEQDSDRFIADMYLKALQENAAEEIKTIDGLINYISETTEELNGPQREWFHDHLGQIALAARRMIGKGDLE